MVGTKTRFYKISQKPTFWGSISRFALNDKEMHYNVKDDLCKCQGWNVASVKGIEQLFLATKQIEISENWILVVEQQGLK